MWSPPANRQDRPEEWATRWLRVLKLLLTVVLLALAVWNALSGAGVHVGF